MPKAKAKKATTTPPWESETKASSPKKEGRSTPKKHTVKVSCLGGDVILKFSSQREANTARLSIAERCARGAPAYVLCEDNTYSFVPHFGYLVTENE